MKRQTVLCVSYLVFSLGLFLKPTVLGTSTTLSNGFTQKNLETKDIKFNATFQNQKIKQGEKVELRISIKNNYSQNIYRSCDSNDVFQGFKIEIRNLKGEIVTPTKNLIPNNGRFSLWGVSMDPVKKTNSH